MHFDTTLIISSPEYLVNLGELVNHRSIDSWRLLNLWLTVIYTDSGNLTSYLLSRMKSLQNILFPWKRYKGYLFKFYFLLLYQWYITYKRKKHYFILKLSIDFSLYAIKYLFSKSIYPTDALFSSMEFSVWI